MSDQLAGKRTVITGAGSGIGRASAKLFAANGASVLAVDLSDGVHQTVSDINAAGGTAVAVVADAADEAAVESFIGQCVERWGGIDAIYANAGIGGGGKPLAELTTADWERTLRVNTIGPFLAIKHASRHMVPQGGGSIIMTASVAGLRANAGGPDYSASKAGVISLAQTCAYQLYGTGVRVNAICPGLIETGMTRAMFERARARDRGDRIGQVNATARYGQPEEIAAMALFLASDAASYVNGQALPVDGGLSASHPWAFPRS